MKRNLSVAAEIQRELKERVFVNAITVHTSQKSKGSRRLRNTDIRATSVLLSSSSYRENNDTLPIKIVKITLESTSPYILKSAPTCSVGQFK